MSIIRKFLKNGPAVFESSILGMNERNQQFVYRENKRTQFKWANDKILTKERLHALGIACAPTYGVVERMTDIEKVWNSVQHHPALAIKPSKGLGGGGIFVIKKSSDGVWKKGAQIQSEREIFYQMAHILQGSYSPGEEDRVLIEYCIESHPFTLAIYPEGVADFRIILHKDIPLMGMLRVPTQRSGGKANLHQGGMGIGIDMETGCLTEGYSEGRYWKKHPDSKLLLVGHPIPYWKEMVALAVNCSKGFPQLNYLGIDIVLDQQRGPLIMEINVRPGLAIQLVNQQGLKPLLRSTSQKRQKRN